MSGESCSAGEGKDITEYNGEGDWDQPVPSDDEDDCEGYFLEPVGGTVNIAEKIAEANKKLLEEQEEEGKEGDDSRPRKVQFSEDLVNFEPSYYSDDDYTESAQNSIISEEDIELKLSQEDFEKVKNDNESDRNVNAEHEQPEEDIPEEITEEVLSQVTDSKDIVDDTIEKNPKFILIFLPKDQNSSCESIIGEDISEKKGLVNKPVEPEKPAKVKIARPKSAKKSCEISKISPNLNCSFEVERKPWSGHSPLVRTKGKAEVSEKKSVFIGEIKVQIKGRLLKKININDLKLEKVPKEEMLKKCGSRPRSCFRGSSNAAGTGENRPKSAPMTRTCCVIKTELPSYNGLRSEYGLSEEQLQERKQKALESRKQRKQEQNRKRQEEMKKRNENEETFQKWLLNKSKKNVKKKTVQRMDTLTRSDVYIQTHASYAANRSVPYSLDSSIIRKSGNRKREFWEKKRKTILIEKLFDNSAPHFKRSFNIYRGTY